MESIQAVDIRDPAVMISQNGCQIEQPYGLGPKIIGREIMYPRVYQYNVGGVFHQRGIII
jgi:hypothetical protein